MVASRTWQGVTSYLGYGLTANSAGVLHYLHKKWLFDLFGTSIYSLRLSTVVFGFAAVPLLYFLVRRLAGVGVATAATVLLIVAPEQLYWSRIETGQFAPIAVLALVSAHLGLWMVQRFSFAAVFLTALWMPVSRCAYAPAYVLVGYPLLLYAHAVAFVKGAWRKVWYVLPLLGAGMALWIYSVSIIYASVKDGRWQFVHPAHIFGAPAWRMHGQPQFRDAGWLELVRLQSVSMAEKSLEVVNALWVHDPRMFSQWFQRVCVLPDHMTVLNPGVAAMFALGLGYLVGQLKDRRAFLLLLWVGLGLAPAIMSNEPTTRRLSLLLPAVHVIAAVWLGALVGIVRTRSQPWLGSLTAVLLGVVLAVVAWTSLVSHFRMPTGPVWVAPAVRFGGPLIRESNVILHNLDPGLAKIIALGNMDDFLSRPLCYENVAHNEWLQAALNPDCRFDGDIHQATMSPAQLDAARRAHEPERVTFLLEETPHSRPIGDLLDLLFPEARRGGTPFANGNRVLKSRSVDFADILALRSPELHVGRAARDLGVPTSGWLAGVPLTRIDAQTGDAAGFQGVVIRGGLRIDQDGWYRLSLGPACETVELVVDGERVQATETKPMLAGVHPFEIRLSGEHSCRLPMRLFTQADNEEEERRVPPASFVSPRVASLGQTRARPVVPYAGYGEANVVASLAGAAEGFGVDARGHISVLILQRGEWAIQRFDPRGREEARWSPRLAPGRWIREIVVDRDGSVILSAESTVLRFDQDGRQLRTWEAPWAAWATDIGVAPGGEILLAVPSRNSIAVLGRDGRLRGEFTRFQGGPRRFSQPTGLAVDPSGQLMVIQDDGQILLFRIATDPLAPLFVNAFDGDFGASPVHVRGGAFAGEGLLLIPDPSTGRSLVYNARGERLMAGLPARDLERKGVGSVMNFVSAGGRLYALERHRVWSIAP
jgi:hypothetical protein